MDEQYHGNDSKQVDGGLLDLNTIRAAAVEKPGEAIDLAGMLKSGYTHHDLHLVNPSRLSPEERQADAATYRAMREAYQRRKNLDANGEPELQSESGE